MGGWEGGGQQGGWWVAAGHHGSPQAGVKTEKASGLSFGGARMGEAATAPEGPREWGGRRQRCSREEQGLHAGPGHLRGSSGSRGPPGQVPGCPGGRC